MYRRQPLKEEELELLLTECHGLLLDDSQSEVSNIEFVTRQIDLEAGRLGKTLKKGPPQASGMANLWTRRST
jgi:hypothetical protein